MFQMRRYVGENVARQMDGDLVPYDDAILFADEKVKASLATLEAAVKEKEDIIAVVREGRAEAERQVDILLEQIAALKKITTDPCKMSEILLPMGFFVTTKEQWDNKDECNRNHVKVYANYTFTTDPPISPWICAKCGYKGQDRAVLDQGPTYDEIVRKFEKGR